MNKMTRKEFDDKFRIYCEKEHDSCEHICGPCVIDFMVEIGVVDDEPEIKAQ